jgi:hypothetical protein
MGVTIKDLWMDDFEQTPACSAWMGVIIVLLEQLKPGPDFEVVRDDSLHQFSEELH